MLYDKNIKCYKGNIKTSEPKSANPSAKYEKGEIIALTNYLAITTVSTSFDKNYERIGKIIQPEEMDSIFAGKKIALQFLLVEEKKEAPKKNETPKKREKSEDWKSVKILKRFKALKRYRIEKRIKNYKH